MRTFVLVVTWSDRCVYLSSGVEPQHLLRLVLHFFKRQTFVVVACEALLLQGDHDPPAGGRAGAPQQSHVRSHGLELDTNF